MHISASWKNDRNEILVRRTVVNRSKFVANPNSSKPQHAGTIGYSRSVLVE